MQAQVQNSSVMTRTSRLDDRDSELAAVGGEELSCQRLDTEVERDVLRAMGLDSLVPLSVDARVRDGIVTLSGTVRSARERDDAKHVAGRVPGVLGVIDETSELPSLDVADETMRDAVRAALARTAIADLAELTVEAPYSGTVVLFGAVTSRSDHDLALATAWSVAEVEAVDDCILVEC